MPKRSSLRDVLDRIEQRGRFLQGEGPQDERAGLELLAAGSERRVRGEQRLLAGATSSRREI